MAQPEQIENTYIPPQLIPEVTTMCNQVFDELTRTLSDPRYPLGMARHDNARILGYAEGGSFWHGLPLGETTIGLEVYRQGSPQAPLDLEAMSRQWYWAAPIRIEHPSVAKAGFMAGFELMKSPDATYYAIRPDVSNSDPVLFAPKGTAEEALLRPCGVDDVHGLWDAIREAARDRPPTTLFSIGKCAIEVGELGKKYHLISIKGGEQRTLSRTPGERMIKRYLSVAYSREVQFRAAWSCVPDIEETPLQVQCRVPEGPKKDASPMILKHELDFRDQDKIGKVTGIIFALYKRYFLATQSGSPQSPHEPGLSAGPESRAS